MRADRLINESNTTVINRDGLQKNLGAREPSVSCVFTDLVVFKSICYRTIARQLLDDSKTQEKIGMAEQKLRFAVFIETSKKVNVSARSFGGALLPGPNFSTASIRIALV